MERSKRTNDGMSCGLRNEGEEEDFASEHALVGGTAYVRVVCLPSLFCTSTSYDVGYYFSCAE